ncbi:MAG: excinuclease ABC subunit UvrC [Spirochaetales bacterium]|nr:excinuclease ABC subunit UvrC [Spirochaetales bacterium]
MKNIEPLEIKIKSLSNESGVYIMKDANNKIIYIGKAKDIKKRVQSYFRKDRDLKTQFLMQQVCDIEIIITRDEYEALITENNLIKKHQPKYNINLKDGKTYPVIRITNEEFPRIFRTRRLVFDGSSYYGPFPSIEELDITLELIEKLYPLRKCKGHLKKRVHPCLYFHINRCAAPCAGKITKEAYRERVNKIKQLLAGDTSKLLADLEKKMRSAAKDLDFEKAAVFRDQINAVKQTQDTQNMLSFEAPREDYIGYAHKDNFICFTIVRIQDGNILTKEIFRSPIYELDPQEALGQFIYQYYSKRPGLPHLVFVPVVLKPELIEALKNELHKNIKFRTAESDHDKKTIRMAIQNANQELMISHVDGLVDLKEKLSLSELPLRIEGFDIAHLSGTHTVASMVSFFQGKPDPTSYRRFKIKSLDGKIDDFEAMREVIARRYMRLINEELELPNLILIDGGKGQLEAARSILKGLDVASIPIIGLAKKHEEIYIPEMDSPLQFPLTSPALRILVAVRNESHRFANTFHKLLRDRDMSTSLLEKIKGIGKKKAKKLLTEFGSLDAIIATEIKKVAACAKIPEHDALLLVAQLKAELGEDVTEEK